jgi:hypothetical protein
VCSVLGGTDANPTIWELDVIPCREPPARSAHKVKGGDGWGHDAGR